MGAAAHDGRTGGRHGVPGRGRERLLRQRQQGGQSQAHRAKC